MTIRWITELLGTAPATEVRGQMGIHIVDVRDLVDKGGNRAEAVREKILRGVEYLESGEKTVVCCDYGISRSNAIAAGILSQHEQIPFWHAVRLVQERTGESEIKLEPLEAVRRALREDRQVRSEQVERKVLITGATGFIGTAARQRLEERFDVIAPSREEMNIEAGSTQLNLWAAEHEVDAIVHLANPRVFTSNVALGKTMTMLRNVIEVCVARGIQLIYPSGWEIYSGYAGGILADEVVPPLPKGPYGETKCHAEVMIEHWRRSEALRCALVRSSPVYGPGGDKPKFVFNFIDKACRSETIVTHHYLNGDAALDLLYIDDFVDAIARIYEQKFDGDVNIGTGETTSTRLIAEHIKEELGSDSSIQQAQIESYTANISMDYGKAGRELGWQPTVALREGLSRLLVDYQVQDRIG